jgi:spermidine/putrescine transport system permease protein
MTLSKKTNHKHQNSPPDGNSPFQDSLVENRHHRNENWFNIYSFVSTYGIFLVILLPLILVVLFSFNSISNTSWPMRGFSLRWYVSISKEPRILEVIVNSLRLALIVAPVSTILGLFGGIALARYDFPGKRILNYLRILPIMMPGLIIALGLLALFQSRIEISIWTLAIGHISVILPFTLLIIQSRMQEFDRRQEDASYDLGASWWITYTKVVFPQIYPAIRSAFFFSVILSLNEVIIAFFLSGVDTTLPVYMYSQFLHFLTPELNAISGVVIALAVILLLFERMVTSTITSLRKR